MNILPRLQDSVDIADGNKPSTYFQQIWQRVILLLQGLVHPAASATPGNKGDLVFELTNNTTLKIKVMGLDGTIRSVSLTLT